MNPQVTALSKFDDTVWNYWEEYHACQNPSECRISWNGVWERNPAMCATVKAHIWASRTGTAKQRPLEWSSLLARQGELRVMANLLEATGKNSFVDLTASLLNQIAARLPQTRAGWYCLRSLERIMHDPTLPHLPAVNPFGRKTASDWVKPDKVKQTRPLSDALIKAMIERCMEYELDVPELVRLRKTQDWECPFAVRRHIRNGWDLRQAWRMAQTAGFIMMLAATGMRSSEVLRIERGGLVCVQGLRTYWCIQSRVFKFHRGKKTKWVCGLLGQRAYHLLRQLSPEKRLATTYSGAMIKALTLHEYLAEWMNEQGWVDEQGEPLTLHSHQFRRTLARRLIRYPKVNLLAMRDHFKHRTVKMTSYYVGCDDELRHAILDRYPNASAAHFQAELRRRAGLEGAA